MKYNSLINQIVIVRLQNEAMQLLQKSKLVFGEIEIFPKEIEVYYYKEGEFMDNSVHRNELQKNNSNHFYIHRKGKSKYDAYKGGNYPGIDFVVSDDDNMYYSYLIRSAVVNGKLVVGPHKVLLAIKAACNFSFEEIESKMVEQVPIDNPNVALFSRRVNLGKRVFEDYKNCSLRAVLCDDCFKGSKYPYKEEMIRNYISKEKMPQEHALNFAKDFLGYIPSFVKTSI
jgi:hypothetical protein